MLEDKTIDECIKTSSCTGNCTGICVINVSDVVPPSALDQGRGKTRKTVKDNVQLSPEVSECIIDIHCAGDCTCVQQGTQLAEMGETGYIVNDIKEQSAGQNIHPTINPGYNFQLPSFTEWMVQFQRGDGDDQHDQEDGHQGGEVRAQGGEVMGGGGGGDGRVGRLVEVHERSVETQKKKSRMRTPKRRRGIIRDGLVQTRLASFATLGACCSKLREN